MIHMIGEVLGLHDPQFYGPGYRPGYYTTAQTRLPTGTGRTRLVSNSLFLVLEAWFWQIYGCSAGLKPNGSKA